MNELPSERDSKEFNDRRVKPRAPLNDWAAVYLENECFFAEITDLATGGIALLSPFQWMPGRSTFISFSLPGSTHLISTKAVIARCDLRQGKCHWGMTFESLKPPDLGAIELFVKTYLSEQARKKYQKKDQIWLMN